MELQGYVSDLPPNTLEPIRVQLEAALKES